MPKPRLFFLIALIIAGLIIVMLPDNDQRLFSLSEGHGPSLLDAIGLLLVLIPYSYLLFAVWCRRKNIVKLKRSRLLVPGVLLFLISVSVLIFSVANDLGWWWLPAAGVMGLIQAYVFYIALK